MSMLSYIIGLFRRDKRLKNDSVSDQYNRLFMVRLLLICSVIMILAWHRSSIRCHMPKSTNTKKHNAKQNDGNIGDDFIKDMCWLQGLYLYKELFNESIRTPYYGMHRSMSVNGMTNGTTEGCTTGPDDDSCIPMNKIYFSQYQFMPFAFVFIAIIYYLPYLAFLSCNKEKYELKKAIKKDSKCAEKIVTHLFRKYLQDQPRSWNILFTESHRMTIAVIMNIVTKVLYVMINVVIFMRINTVLKGSYFSYGAKSIKWFNLDEAIRQKHVFPGNYILPTVGYCEFVVAASDVKVLCELSQNTIYQYCLLVLWFAIIFGIAVSFMGLFQLLFYYVCLILWSSRESYEIRRLTLRQLDLLDYIRQKDFLFYEECRKLLRKEENAESSMCTLLDESKGI